MEPVVVPACVAMVLREASIYPFSRNSLRAHSMMRSYTPSLCFANYFPPSITMLCNTVMSITRLWFSVNIFSKKRSQPAYRPASTASDRMPADSVISSHWFHPKSTPMTASMGWNIWDFLIMVDIRSNPLEIFCIISSRIVIRLPCSG